MVTVLESHLSLHEREAEDRPSTTTTDHLGVVEDLIALHAALYERLERHLGQDGVTEAHRPLVPLFTRWLHTARRITDAARELRRGGLEVAGFDLLLRTINLAKPMVEDFDYLVQLNERLARGEPGTYRPLGEVMDELRRRDQSAGESHLSLLEREAEGRPSSTTADRVDLLEDLIALHVALYERLERHLG